MRLLHVLMLSGFTLLVLNSCSEKQKEAARMEQEVKDLEAEGDTSPAVQSAVETVQPSSETVAVTPEGSQEPVPADPSAVPPESAPASVPARPTETVASQPPTETPKPAMPPAPTGVGYTVQIASCESEDYARHLIGVYTKRGYEPFVATISYNNLVYYRVRIGQFPTVAAAKALRDELSDRFSIKPWVDRTE
jgi:cell division septation protein DedD